MPFVVSLFAGPLGKGEKQKLMTGDPRGSACGVPHSGVAMPIPVKSGGR